MIEKYLMKDQ